MPTSLADLGYTRASVDGRYLACAPSTTTACKYDCGGVNGSYHDAEGRPVLNKTGFPDVAAMVAKAAAYVLGCCSCLFAILLGLAGGSLLRQLRKMRSSSAVITATHRGTYSAAGRRLLLFTIAFASCFFLQVGTD